MTQWARFYTTNSIHSNCNSYLCTVCFENSKYEKKLYIYNQENFDVDGYEYAITISTLNLVTNGKIKGITHITPQFSPIINYYWLITLEIEYRHNKISILKKLHN